MDRYDSVKRPSCNIFENLHNYAAASVEFADLRTNFKISLKFPDFRGKFSLNSTIFLKRGFKGIRKDEKKMMKIPTDWQEKIYYRCLWTPETRLEFGEDSHR